jgi:hypothetical protein
MNNTTNIEALKPLLADNMQGALDPWGPAPWMNEDGFYVVRTVLTGFSLWLSLFSLIKSKTESEAFQGFEYFTSWGVHGTSFSFVVMWLPYTLKWYNGWGEGYETFPSFLIDWSGSWAVYHQQCLLVWEMMITLSYWPLIFDVTDFETGLWHT